MVTENELAALPFLLSGKEVRRIFGLGKDELRKLERAGVLHRCPTSRKGKWFKAELMRVARLRG